MQLHGLPVVNSQECEEYKKVVQEWQIGLNCKNKDSVDMAEKIYELYKNKEKRLQMGKNNRKLAEEKFDRKVTYNKIINVIENKNQF